MQSLPRLKSLSLLRIEIEKTSTINHLRQIQAQLVTNGINSPAIFAKLIQRCCIFSSPCSTNYARQVLLHFDDPNVYLLNVLIRCTPPRDSIHVFANWVSRADLLFDDFTYIFVLGACARTSTVSSLWEGKQVHARIVKHGFLSNIMVQTTAIHFYASSKDIRSARQMFDEMSIRSSVTWNAMIKGYCSQREKVMDHGRDALKLFQNMLLVDFWGVKPTDTTIVCVLSAASQLGILETGICIHGFVQKTIYMPENDVYISTGLVDMYSKCGCLASALYVFSRMNEKNVMTWTAMATGLAIHGKGKEALELLDAMDANGIKPNEVTFTSLFFACCHMGLVEEGLSLFYNMESKFLVKPNIQHFGCIVDLLGRAGHLKEAYEFISSMEVEPDTILWKSLLNSCKVHGDVGMGEKIGKILLQTQPKQSFVGLRDTSEDYLALSNVYASAERWDHVEMVRREIKTKGIETKPGYSSVYSLSNQVFDGL